MGIFDDNRRLYGVLLLLGGAWCARAGGLDPRAALLLLVVGVGLAGAGLGLLLRVRWARAVGCALVASVVAHMVARRLLVGEPFTVWRVLLLLAAAWGVVDLARTDVTEAEEAARRARAEAAARLEAGRLRARLAHLREHLEALEEQVREAHEAQGHALDFDACEQDDCAELRARLAETWTKLGGERPGTDAEGA
ncbi:MAG: hypothetical protein M9894_31640 [Planctomycetes bacterium]|nr:hypothetical protein [Planctomycetota bacterium]